MVLQLSEETPQSAQKWSEKIIFSSVIVGEARYNTFFILEYMLSLRSCHSSSIYLSASYWTTRKSLIPQINNENVKNTFQEQL